jgi:hypothetical protein
MTVTVISPTPHPSSLARSGVEDTRPSVLVLGVYLANKPTYVRSVVKNLSTSAAYRIVQRWVAIGGVISDSLVQSVTCIYQASLSPKFSLMNQLIAQEHVDSYDYVVIADDDIQLPEGFLDGFLATQSAVGFSLAQPARTSVSYIDHSITRRVEGMLARETLFVEVGPVTCFHRSVFHLVFPFDMACPMGWGYETIWALRLSQKGFKMGIVDAYPVDHSLRPPAIYYDWTEAKQATQRLLNANAHLPLRRCLTTLRTIPMLSKLTELEERKQERFRHLFVLGHGLFVKATLFPSKLVRRAKRISLAMGANPTRTRGANRPA